jgi:hypothetical protein
MRGMVSDVIARTEAKTADDSKDDKKAKKSKE